MTVGGPGRPRDGALTRAAAHRHRGTTMLVDLSNFDWKLLRIILRAGKPVNGRTLRHTPTRFSKDGTFLGKLVERGLIAVATDDPDPFAATYTLTAVGRTAAEHGEYEARMPWEKAADEVAKPAAKKRKA